jgi:hypothetical protein
MKMGSRTRPRRGSRPRIAAANRAAAPPIQCAVQSRTDPFVSTFQGTGGRAFRVIHAVGRQPSWVIRATLGAGVLVLLAILAVILVPVIAAMMAVFAVSSGFARVRRWFSPFRSPDTLIILDERQANEGRRNVRILR